MKRTYFTALTLAVLAAPSFAFAALGGVKGYISDVQRIISLLLVVVSAIALLAFFWGLAQFIFKAGDPKANEGGKNLMIWGVVALFVMVSVWGLVRFIQIEFGISEVQSVTIPGFTGL